ncbi:uncharacterized protein TEOVI_000447500 [Trypanosoma equiperdum]|uniref:Uncharacterized protein n=3 Tax=Trypanozoon TaxID=39700 RepID=Q38DJ4_TRYB2|nr:hypothetical protein, conserved [Trypanosoma brucei gambiense DAL972]XP_827456.1 hypothetical protein, conserved [Trypanosoma brucei brucei TREU927]EAN77126.1 hypothetical protein, conserved [Trypanosoma brucei brucei TREU927]CBH14652.1 hypothetical protein, conserved [Trypanosoma brucei gambiense DAL972]SCU72891.1 hypothetical protein, conserved [Trypanosoma equiperdum]|eukprot:XP_011776918.1 hypothetical protein, conserved [Trypanosoma brucei gambiense DAL972]
MDLDIVDDAEVYANSLRDARIEIMRGMSSTGDGKLGENCHPFLKEVVVDGRRQAEQQAAVLAATEFFINELLTCLECGMVLNGVKESEATQWRVWFRIFLSLYEASPAPTQAQWEHEMRLQNCETYFGETLDSGSDNNDWDEEDDGSNVEFHLRTLVTHCLAAARTWRRQRCEAGNTELMAKLQRATSIMCAFVEPHSLDW